MYTLESLQEEIFTLIKDQASEFIKEDLMPEAKPVFKEVAKDIALLKWEMLMAEDEDTKQRKQKSIDKYFGVLKLKYAQKRAIFKSRSRKTAINVTYAIIRTVGKMALSAIGMT